MMKTKEQPKALRRFDREFDLMRREMEGFLAPFGRMLTRPRWTGMTAWTPTMDVFEEKDQFIFRADLPGVKRQDVQITLTDDVLTIEGERKEDTSIEDDAWLYKEAFYGHFLRRFDLPAKVDPEAVEARFENGVLEVRVPKGVEKEAAIVPIQES